MPNSAVPWRRCTFDRAGECEPEAGDQRGAEPRHSNGSAWSLMGRSRSHAAGSSTVACGEDKAGRQRSRIASGAAR